MAVSFDDVCRLPRLCDETVPESWLDEYGHMNVGNYLEMWRRGAGAFMIQLGLEFRELKPESGEAATSEVGYWLLRQVLDYLAEVRVGEDIAVYGRVLDCAGKMLHNKYWLVNETTSRVAAASEVLVGRADLNARRLADFPPGEIQQIDERLAEFKTLDWDPEPSGAIELSHR